MCGGAIKKLSWRQNNPIRACLINRENQKKWREKHPIKRRLQKRLRALYGKLKQDEILSLLGAPFDTVIAHLVKGRGEIDMKE